MDKVCEYIPTKEECIAFAKDRAGHTSPVFKPFKVEKELNGQLVLIEGNNVTVISYDLPWSMLNHIRDRYVRNGYTKKNLKLKRLSWKHTKLNLGI